MVISDESPSLIGPVDRAAAVLLVKIGQRRYGLPLTAVERVLPMAFVLTLPDTDHGLLGMLNLHGQALPVIDPHQRLGLPTPKLSLDHRLILMRSSVPFLLWVEEVDEVVESGADAMSAVPAPDSNGIVPRVLRLGDELVPVLAPAALEPHGPRQ
ncbi:MAG TPA: chemotaxis protein CheW [Chloroflexota bacterium]|nr:chemotaxis protein CheW [Chloroflexota bacterium]